MIATSPEYQAAIVGSPRRVEILAIVDLSDPDLVWGPVLSSGLASWSKADELHNKEFETPPRLATLEWGRWLLDGSFDGFPADYSEVNGVGVATEAVSGSSGAFSQPVFIRQELEHVHVLQMLSIFFSSDPLDGVPEDFVVEVLAGEQVYLSKEYTGSTATEISITGFTVYDPTAIRLTVTKTTLPYRRVRVMEILPGLYERWPSRMFATFSCVQQGEFSCLSLPYGSVTMAIDNKSRRFEPRRKDGIFQSIEERQAIDVYIGVRLASGSYEHVRLGLFYMAGDGWKTGDNSLTMQWYLVDIIGVLTDRSFLWPAEEDLPTTLGGWLEAIVLQLGENFRYRYSADPDYIDKPVTAKKREDVVGKKCGDLIRWVCQASGTWPRADAETGKLCAEPLWNQGNQIALANLVKYPTMGANRSLAALIFTLSDGTELVISGNSTSSEDTVRIVNPFLHTAEQARAAARLILAQYGGNVLETTGRGDPSSEIGDVDTIQLDESNATTARRKSQTIQFQEGVMQNCPSTLLQADGSYLWENFEVIRESGSWRAPPGVRQLRLVLGQGGQGGGHGEDGYVREGWDTVEAGYGDPGQDGQGGKIWYGVIDCNEEQEFAVHLGAGGAAASVKGVPGAKGEHTAFGAYSSANGQVYEQGYTDIANGQIFARPGVEAPLPGTGDGGKGGRGGDPGAGIIYEVYDKETGQVVGTRFEVTEEPGPGHKGVDGATGFVMVTWDKPAGTA